MGHTSMSQFHTGWRLMVTVDFDGDVVLLPKDSRRIDPAEKISPTPVHHPWGSWMAARQGDHCRPLISSQPWIYLLC